MNDIDKGWTSPFDVNIELVVRRSMELHDLHKSAQAKFTISVDWFTIAEKESLLVILEEVLVQCEVLVVQLFCLIQVDFGGGDCTGRGEGGKLSVGVIRMAKVSTFILVGKKLVVNVELVSNWVAEIFSASSVVG